MTAAEHITDFKLTTDTPYLALTGVYCEDLGENLYKGTTLYLKNTKVYTSDKFASICKAVPFFIQSTPVISRHLGAKIRKRELSGSPVMSRESAKAQTRDFHRSESHTVTSAPLITKQYVER